MKARASQLAEEVVRADPKVIEFQRTLTAEATEIAKERAKGFFGGENVPTKEQIKEVEDELTAAFDEDYVQGALNKANAEGVIRAFDEMFSPDDSAATTAAPSTPATTQPTTQSQPNQAAAIEWLSNNPTHPLAPQVRAKLGGG